MRERVAELVGGVERRMWVMTFHAACARLLRIEAERLGYKKSFTIYDQADSLRMVKRCLADLDVDTKRYPPRSVQARISDAQEPADGRGDLRRGRRLAVRGDGRRRSTASTSAACSRPTRWTSTTC